MVKYDWELLLTHLGVIDEGGSSYIIESEINANYGELKKNQKVVLKHCIAFLTKYACDLFKNEANYLKKLKELYINKICGNFPIFYGYYQKCLFGEIEIMEKINLVKNKYNFDFGIPNGLFYFSNLPNVTIEYYESLRNKYEIEQLKFFKENLKIKNFQVIQSLFQNKSHDGTEIYNFLEEEFDIGCSPNIIISYIQGFNLLKKETFKIDDGMLFDLLYTNACLIYFNNQVFSDDNLSNIMVEYSDTPRIYEINNIFYYFKVPKLFIIDVQVTKIATSVKDLYGKISARSNLEQKKFLSQIDKKETIYDVLTDLFPIYFSNYIISKEFSEDLLLFNSEIELWKIKLTN